MRFFLTLAATVLSAALWAQDPGFPPSFKWKQIHTDTARLIFSRGSESQAARIAALVHRLAADTPLALGAGHRKVDILLHNRTVFSNGYVTPAPFHSGFYLVPSPDIFLFGNLPWHELLAIHEYRHVQQFNAFRYTQLGKLGQGILGDFGLGAVLALSAPDWFFEGDAVYAETALTGYGRGRQGMFLSEFKSLWQEGLHYNWKKLRNGSYRDLVPNHYPLGYLMVHYGYARYGADFWRKVIREAGALNNWTLFGGAVQRVSGQSYRRFRSEALRYFSSRVRDTAARSDRSRPVTDYLYPQVQNDTLVYLETGFQQPARFVWQHGSRRQKISLQNITSDRWFRRRGDQIVYTAFRPDPRWSLVNYSDIVLLHTGTGKQKWLTRNQRLYSPDLSPSGQRIAAVQVTDSLQSALVLLSASDGRIQQRWNRQGAFYMHPFFRSENEIFAVVRNDSGEVSVQRFQTDRPNPEPVIPFTRHTIGYPYVSADTLYFTASFTGNDELYAFPLGSRRLFRLTHTQTGNYYASVNNGLLSWSYYTARGLALRQARLAEMGWTEIPLEAALNSQADSLTLAPRLPWMPAAAADRSFTTQPYPKSTRFFNYHSWLPLFADPGISLTVFGQNVLNTFSHTLQYTYNINEASHTVGTTAGYGAWFLRFDLAAEHSFQRTLRRPGEDITLRQSEGYLRASLPLDFTRGKSVRFLELATSAHLNSIRFTGASRAKYRARNDAFMAYEIYGAQYRPMAYQQLYPRLGYSLYGEYRHLTERRGYRARAQALVYLPSVVRTHGWQAEFSYQQSDTGNVVFSNEFSNARGYRDYFFPKMWKAGLQYAMPLFYPDAGFLKIFYLKRVRSHLFYDHARVYDKLGASATLRSGGAELIADLNLFNSLQAAVGVRYSRLFDRGPGDTGNRNVWEFIIPLNPFSTTFLHKKAPR